MTKRLLAVVAGAIGPVLFVAGSAEALSIGSVSGGGTPDGTAAVKYEGNATYTRPDNSSIVGPVAWTIIQKDFTSLTQMDFTVTYAGSDLDFSNSGLRWSERIYNNTSTPWTDYHMIVVTPGVFYNDSFSPSVTSINQADLNSISSPVIVQQAPNGTLVLSADKREITFTFATSIAPGGYLDVHTPIDGLSSSGGTFELKQAPSVAQAVPVPGAGLAGMVLLAGMWLMKRGRGVEQ